LPITIARLDLGQKPWRLEFVDLETVGRSHSPTKRNKTL
jgi:hypothetical protein